MPPRHRWRIGNNVLSKQSTLRIGWCVRAQSLQNSRAVRAYTLATRARSVREPHSSRVWAPPARAVRDGGDVGQDPEAVAIIAERLGADRQRSAGDGRVRALEGRHQRVLRVQEKRVAHPAQFGGDRRAGGAGDLVEQRAEL